jgi:two-component system, OmpR family, sensor histidine kinase TctE
MPELAGLRGRGLRDRLMLLLFGPLSLLFLLSLPGDYKLALEPSNAAYDHALANSAVAVASRVVVRGDEIKVDLSGSAETVLLTDRVDRTYYSVLGPDGRQLAGNAPLIPAGDELENPAFSEAVVLGEKVRQASLFHWTAAGRVVVVVAETRGKREDTASRIAVAMMLPNLLLILATTGIIYFAVLLALRPLDRLGEEIGRRSPHDLSPLPEDEGPLEAQPLVAAINGLIGDLRTAAAAQQAFLANAAHQLRTPLAGLQTQLELAAQDIPPEQRPRIARISDATQRLSHLAHQLLSLARSGTDADLGHEREQVDLGGLLEEVAPQFMDPALERNMDLGFEASSVAIDASRWLLREMVSNLLDNAIRYGAGGGTVTARCGIDDERRAFIEVEDDGPGIRPEDRARIFERFYRAPDSGGTGTGLGLAIVREVANRHQADIAVSAGDEGKGTRIRVSFPTAG